MQHPGGNDGGTTSESVILLFSGTLFFPFKSAKGWVPPSPLFNLEGQYSRGKRKSLQRPYQLRGADGIWI